MHFQSVRQEGAAAALARHQLLQMRLVNGGESVLVLEHPCKKHNRKLTRTVFKFLFVQYNGRPFAGFRTVREFWEANNVRIFRECEYLKEA